MIDFSQLRIDVGRQGLARLHGIQIHIASRHGKAGLHLNGRGAQGSVKLLGQLSIIDFYPVFRRHGAAARNAMAARLPETLLITAARAICSSMPRASLVWV